MGQLCTLSNEYRLLILQPSDCRFYVTLFRVCTWFKICKATFLPNHLPSIELLIISRILGSSREIVSAQDKLNIVEQWLKVSSWIIWTDRLCADNIGPTLLRPNVTGVRNTANTIGHVNQYPKTHYSGNPRNTQSMMLTEYFW